MATGWFRLSLRTFRPAATSEGKVAPGCGRAVGLRDASPIASTAACLGLVGVVGDRARHASRQLRSAGRARHQDAGAPEQDLPFVGLPESNLNNAGVQYAARGGYDAAIREFQPATEYRPDYLPGHKNLLAAYMQTEEWREALGPDRMAEELHPLAHRYHRLLREPPFDGWPGAAYRLLVHNGCRSGSDAWTT
jgi:tetratricopeptide (TPR) repeat protein